MNVDEEEQWKVFDFVEDSFMEELEIGDYINDINSYHLHMFDKHDVTTKKLDVIVEKAGKVDAVVLGKHGDGRSDGIYKRCQRYGCAIFPT